MRFKKVCVSSYGLTRMRLVNPRRGTEGFRHRRCAGKARRFRSGPEAALSLVNPACSLAFGLSREISMAQARIPTPEFATRNPRQIEQFAATPA